MKGKDRTKRVPAVIFGQKCVKKIGYIDKYIFACEIAGGDHIKYTTPRRPKYHLVIIVIRGMLKIIANGKEYVFQKNSYINLPIWADIYEIEYTEDFHALATATDKTIIDDIFQNRSPFPPDFMLRVNHSFGGQIFSAEDMKVLTKDIFNLIDSLNTEGHFFVQELTYSYFYILLIDMANIMWKLYGKGYPAHKVDLRRADSIFQDFIGLLQSNIRSHTDVGFYAEKLCVSKKYLSFIVKSKTTVSIGAVISSMRAEVAAGMLRDPELSIQQIATMLSFSDQSSFGKFFKKHSGVAPSQYRQNLRKTLLSKRK